MLMNNMNHFFRITLSGNLVDDKKFYEYDDFSDENGTYPTDAESLTKAQAYIRFKHVKRILSNYNIPIYFTVEYGTDGTTSTVPTDATIVVGYNSIEQLLSVYIDEFDVSNYPEEEDYPTAAATTLKSLIDASFNGELVEFAELSEVVTRDTYNGSATEEDYRQTITDYVTSAPSTVDSTVEYIVIE